MLHIGWFFHGKSQLPVLHRLLDLSCLSHASCLKGLSTKFAAPLKCLWILIENLVENSNKNSFQASVFPYIFVFQFNFKV